MNSKEKLLMVTSFVKETFVILVFITAIAITTKCLFVLSHKDFYLGDMYKNNNIIKDTNKVSSKAKKYLEFCKTFGLKQ